MEDIAGRESAGAAAARGGVLAVGGLAAEARIARGVGWAAVVAGGRPDVLAARLGALGDGWSAVLSFGIAAGLDPALVPGAVVVPSRVLAAGQDCACDAGLVRALRAALGAVFPADAIAGVATPILERQDKRALHRETAAAAADLESHVAAAFAAARGIPFAAVRVVCDPADRTVPAFAATALKEDGTADIAAVLRGLSRQPAALPALLRLARDSRTALATLRRIAPVVARALPL